MDSKLEILGEKIMLVGNRGDKNMGDELILVGLIKLLQRQGKKLYIPTPDPIWLENFHKQFVDTTGITYFLELPKGVRSFVKYVSRGGFRYIQHFHKVNSIIIGGGEIFTEETPFSYFFWPISILPILRKKVNIYLMGGIQIPQRKRNQIALRYMLKKTKIIFARDYDCVEELKKIGYTDATFFMDTSYFAVDNWKQIPDDKSQIEELGLKGKKYIVVNSNHKGSQYTNDLCEEISNYINNGYTVVFAPVRIGSFDDDTAQYYHIQDVLGNKPQMILCDWTQNFIGFLNLLLGAEKVITVRLHLFLIAKFLGCDTKVYPYQRKIIKMDRVLKGIMNS